MRQSAALSRALPAMLVAAAAAIACGPPKVRPAFFPDPDVPCPGGRTAWSLNVVDRRAERKAHEQVLDEVREGVEKSFPGCRWLSSGEAGAPAITIEIYRLSSVFDHGSWEAAANWGVSVTDEGGRRLLEFEANEEVSRPDYTGSNNEKESLSEAYQRALERTTKGLANLPKLISLRPPEETPPDATARSSDP
jgi:hypothetical protein